MKIEKVNDHQIRCTLTGADLANRQLKISELAYGSEKAKSLFRDMMQQASFEFGFEAEDIPLMIEAIPVNADCIVLIITKVEDPDELDTRFSKFSPMASEEDEPEEGDVSSALASNIADDVLDLFHKIKNSAKAATPSTEKEAPAKEAENFAPRMVKSTELTSLCTFARIADRFYEEPTALYKNPATSEYCLLLSQGGLTQEQYGRVLNLASEYGNVEKVDTPKKAYIEEHSEHIIEENAISSLAKI